MPIEKRPFRIVRYATDAGRITALVRAGYTRVSVLTVDGLGLKLKHVHPGELRYMTDVKDYPIRKAVTRFRAAGRVLGMSKAARAFLRAAK